jgi:predicted phage-related endonuclease
MTILKHPIEDRQSWLQWRKSDLTCSDLGAAIGVDPHKTMLKLYAEKTGMVIGDEDNGAMRRGRWLESAAAVALKEKHPEWDIRKPDMYLRDVICKLGGTPDYIAEDPADPGLINCQVKVVSRPIFDRDWSDGPPLRFVLQTLAECYLMNAKRGLLVVLVIDTYSATLEEFPIERHAAAEARILNIAADFWDNVESGKRPVADYERDGETVAQMFPRATDKEVLDLSQDNRLPEILVERETLRETIETSKKRLDALDTEIKEKIADHEAAALPGWSITWREQTRKSYVVAESTFRVLRVKNLNVEEAA